MLPITSNLQAELADEQEWQPETLDFMTPTNEANFAVAPDSSVLFCLLHVDLMDLRAAVLINGSGGLMHTEVKGLVRVALTMFPSTAHRDKLALSVRCYSCPLSRDWGYLTATFSASW